MGCAAFVGVDLGTTGLRAVAVEPGGRELAAARASLPSCSVRRDAAGCHEQDTASWRELLEPCLAELLERLPPGAEVVALACTSTSGTVVGIDRVSGEPTAALMYDDARAVAQARLCSDLSGTPWSTASGLPKMGWLNARAPARLRFVHAGDLLYEWLAQRALPTDATTAMKSGWPAAPSLAQPCTELNEGWPRGLLRALVLEPHQLPAVVAPGTVIGEVHPDVRRRLGLRGPGLLVAGATDANTAFYASGASEPGDWHCALGSTLAVRARVERALHDPDGAFYLHRHPDGGYLLAAASNAGAAGWEHGDDACLDLARPPRAAWYPLPGRGERFPLRAPALEAMRVELGGLDGWAGAEPSAGGACGRAAPSVRHEEAVVGLALVERWCLELGARLQGAPIGRVLATGGTARSQRWLQVRANVLQLPLLVPEHADSCFGAALLAMAGAQGELLEAVCRRAVRILHQVEPDTSWGAWSRQALQRFQQQVRERAGA